MGISESLFWTLNPTKLKPYIEAERKKDLKADYYNWMLASYIRSAVGSVLNKHNKFPKKPYLQEEEDNRIIDGSNLSEEEQEFERRKFMASMGFDFSNEE